MKSVRDPIVDLFAQASICPRLAVLLVLVLAVAAQAGQSSQQLRIAAFGSVVEIVVRSAPQAQVEAAARIIDREFQAMHRRWHAWEPGPLVEVNQAIARGERTIAVPDDIAALIAESRQLYQASEGLFNPAIGGLLELWGFQSSVMPEGPLPSKAQIRRWLEQSPSMTDLRLTGNVLVSRNPAVQLDFGAYAKGVAVDRAIDILREHGIGHALVNAGGDVRVIGDAGGRVWQIGVRHPEGNRGSILGTIQAADGEAVFTSGNYERFRSDGERRYTHILDPRTGWPVERVTSVTVVGPRGSSADAAATALVVAGVDDWPRIAGRMGIDKVLLVDDAGRVWMTPRMAERVSFRRPPDAVELRTPGLSR